MQKYKKFFYRQKFFVLLENLQRLFHICFKKKGLFFSLLQPPFLSSMPISPSRPRKFGEHATKIALLAPTSLHYLR